MSNSENNKRIAKNTVMLYIRMLITMGVSLFTSRVILQTLGVEDYGIYAVVGGIVSMFTFLNGGMVSATQRYLNFELGRGNQEQLTKVFSTSLQIHFLISLVVLLLSETIGLWFLYEKLVIPAERLDAAFWVFQFSIVACVVSLISVPYNAVIIAHEKMSAFAYMSILEVVLKLLIVYLLYISPWDKLVVYAALLLCVSLLMRWIYARYCKKYFPESHYTHRVDKSLFKEMFSFSGWSLWGNLAAMLYSQGLNMMLNIFFGPVVNAARGIALQVQGVVQSFVTNFQMALNSQITKNYASGDLDQMHNLMFRSARFSFFLLFLLALPILIEANYILHLWLGVVPDDTVVFMRWIIGVSLIYTIANPCVIANQATGKVKVYQAVVGGILLLILPASYVALILGAPAYSVFIIHFCVECIAQFARMYMLRNLIQLPLRAYIKNIYMPVLVVVILSILLPIVVHLQLAEGFMRLIGVGLTCVISVAFSIFIFGLTQGERTFFINKIYSLVRIKR